MLKPSLSSINTAQAALKFIAISVLLAGCASKPLPPPAARPAPPAPAPVVVAPAPPPVVVAPPPVVAAPPVRPGLPLVNSWTEYRRRAAQMIMAANAGNTASGPLQDPLRGIPVVQILLNADGSIRNLDMLRASKVAPETNNVALDAIRRVGNFGPVTNLPHPWQFSETFLYNDRMKFQLRTIVERL